MAVEQDTLIRQLEANMARAVFGKDDVVRLCVVALLAGEHVLLEDVPGVGKTLIGKALAKSVSGTFRRIQFTPDLLPTTRSGRSSFSRRVRFSPTWSWPTRSTAPRPARRARCWRR